MVWSILGKTLTITWFVTVMMVLVEYANVLSVDRLRFALCGSRWTQYVVATILGATPGCLGAFVVVALFIHRSVRLGAVVACMIATSGDESFVMLATFPRTALLLTLVLALVGILAGILTDVFSDTGTQELGCADMTVHDTAASCRCFDPASILVELRRPSAARGTLAIGTFLFFLAVISGTVGPAEWNWIRVTFLGVGLFSLFVVGTVPEHFIEEHLWRHIVAKHAPRIFLWTLASMTLVAVLDTSVNAEVFLRHSPWLMLLGAAFLGLVPESGPHLVVVMLYAAGNVPLSALVANSVVQDGHGMLPLLAHSWRDFMKVKAINLVAGILVGGALMMAGR
ncbi:MAG: putative manganese transporter [Thermoanaerobaculales bacterium]|nr:putative manganese transporter [Thermoanaerobaculales bacterium]